MLAVVMAVIGTLISSCVCECSVEQVHIALGDKFNLEKLNSDHVLTIGLVASGECSELPKVRLHATGGENIDLAHFTAKQIDLQIMDLSLPTPKDVSYKKQGLFFRVTDAHLEKAATWSVQVDGQLKEGPVKFPQRLRSQQDTCRMFVVADMDITPQSAATVKKIREMQEQDYDMLVHVGDFAYEIEDNGGRVGDQFFEEMSKTARQIPYLMVPGNHECYNKGWLLNYRFRMPNTNDKNTSTTNHFYDFVYKGSYFMTVDFDYTLAWYEKPGNPNEDLFNWMKSRLELLDKRSDITWKVFISHRPFICSDWTAKDCFHNMYWLRKFEDLLAKHGFHFLLQGHLHIYTRSKPLKGLTVYPHSKIGSGAMVSIIDGHSGTKHYFKNVSEEHEVWSQVNDAVDASGPTYTMVEITKERFVSTLVRADTGEYRDTFSIDHNMLEESSQFSGRYAWFKLGMVLVLVVSVLLTAFVTYKWVNSNSDSDGSKDEKEADTYSQCSKGDQDNSSTNFSKL